MWSRTKEDECSKVNAPVDHYWFAEMLNCLGSAMDFLKQQLSRFETSSVYFILCIFLASLAHSTVISSRKYDRKLIQYVNLNYISRKQQEYSCNLNT